MTNEYTPFDFIKSASQTKQDLIKQSDQPEYVEKQYVPYVVNRGFSNFEDSILHANELNKLNHLSKYAQYKYYLSVLRPRNRFSKWNKHKNDETLDLVQQFYQCNREVAKQYMTVLTFENIETINKHMAKGGHNGK